MAVRGLVYALVFNADLLTKLQASYIYIAHIETIQKRRIDVQKPHTTVLLRSSLPDKKVSARRIEYNGTECDRCQFSDLTAVTPLAATGDAVRH
jgi:hypothetical protein